MYCSNCGAQIPDGAKFCGSCGKTTNSQASDSTYHVPQNTETKPKKRKLGCLAQIGIFLAIVLFAFMIILIVGSSSDTTSEVDHSKAEAVVSEQDNSNSDRFSSLPVILCDNEYVYAELTDIKDYKDIYGSLAQDMEACYLEVYATNKYAGEITVVLDNLSVNDNMTRAMSGLPLELLEGKSGQNSFLFSYGDLPISEKSEIENIEFCVVIMDENWNELYRSEMISIDFE